MREIDEQNDGESAQLHLRVKAKIENKAQRVLAQMHNKMIGIGTNRASVYQRAIELGLEELAKRLGIEG